MTLNSSNFLLRELYKADFHKLGIFWSGNVWANAWDVFPRMEFRVGRGLRAAVDFAVCFGWDGLFSYVFFFFFPSSNALRLLQV